MFRVEEENVYYKSKEMESEILYGLKTIAEVKEQRENETVFRVKEFDLKTQSYVDSQTTGEIFIGNLGEVVNVMGGEFIVITN